MTAHTIVASFENAERTLAFHLEAGGDLVRIEREHPSDMWSPPETVATLKSSVPDLDDLLATYSGS